MVSRKPSSFTSAFAIVAVAAAAALPPGAVEAQSVPYPPSKKKPAARKDETAPAPAKKAAEGKAKESKPSASDKSDAGKTSVKKGSEKKDSQKKAAKKDGGKSKGETRPARKPSAEPRIAINEILYEPLPDKASRQFVELFNPNAAAVDISAWSLADQVTFRFPQGTRIPAGGYLVAGKDPKLLESIYGITGVVGPWEGKISGKGGFLSLLDSRGDLIEEVAYDDKPPFPVEAAGSGASLERIHPGFKEAWHWRAGATRPEWFEVKVDGFLMGDQLTFYLTGEGSCRIDDVHIVARDGSGPDAVQNGGFEEGIGGWRGRGNHSESGPGGAGKTGKGSLRIVAKAPGFGTIHAVSAKLEGIPQGRAITASFWVIAEKGAGKLVARIGGGKPIAEVQMHVVGGSPGAPNRFRAEDLDPWVRNAWHEPERPLPGQPVTIFAQAEDDEAVAGVTLEYVDSEAEGTPPRSCPMSDCGGLARGGRAFAAMIPPLPEGTIVRYRVVAVDAAGKKTPVEAQKAYYVGKPVARGKSIPTLDLLLSQASVESLARAGKAWVPAIAVFDGIVYDRVKARHRGQTSLGFPKKHLKFHFGGEKFEGLRSVNLSSSYADKSFFRELLACRVFADAGVPHSEVKRFVRVNLNGKHHGLFYQIDMPGDDYLKRNGLDPDGVLMKCNTNGSPSSDGTYSASDFEDKTSPEPRYEELHELLASMHHLEGSDLRAYIKANVDAEEFAAYLAATALVGNTDHIGKNYYLYRDPKSGKWSMLPWDLDLTFGRNYECNTSSPLLNDKIRTDNAILMGTVEHPKCDIGPNRLITKFLSLPENRTLVYRKVAKLLKGFNVEATRRQIRPHLPVMKEEVKLDRAHWGSYGLQDSWDWEKRVGELLEYVDKRAKFLAEALAKEAGK
jgi:hypothetical protein